MSLFSLIECQVGAVVSLKDPIYHAVYLCFINSHALLFLCSSSGVCWKNPKGFV